MSFLTPGRYCFTHTTTGIIRRASYRSKYTPAIGLHVDAITARECQTDKSAVTPDEIIVFADTVARCNRAIRILVASGSDVGISPGKSDLNGVEPGGKLE